MYKILENIVYQNFYSVNTVWPGCFSRGCCAVAKVVFIQVLKNHSLFFSLVVFLDSGREQKKKVQDYYSPDILLRKDAFHVEIRLDVICCEKGVCCVPFKGWPRLRVTALQALNPMRAGDAEWEGGEHLLHLSFWLVNFAEVVVGLESWLFNEVNKNQCKVDYSVPQSGFINFCLEIRLQRYWTTFYSCWDCR